MKRRDALKALVLAPLATQVQAAPVQFFGAIPHWSRRRPFQADYRRFTGIGKGKRALLWRYFEQATNGPLTPHTQGRHSDGTVGEGDCVGHAAALGADVLASCDIHMRHEPEQWIAKASVEMLYAGSRNEIGKGRLRGRPGSHAEWVALFMQKYGILHRTFYQSGENSINLLGYHPGRSREYRDKGVPDWLEPLARRHPVKNITKITSTTAAFDALYVGQPVILTSSYAFKDKRDKDGFCEPFLGPWRRKWYHAWLLAGYDDTGTRPGGLLINSHWLWNSGPKRLGQPDGSHWVDAHILDRMLAEWEDSHAISAYVGHPQRMLDHKLY